MILEWIFNIITQMSTLTSIPNAFYFLLIGALICSISLLWMAREFFSWFSKTSSALQRLNSIENDLRQLNINLNKIRDSLAKEPHDKPLTPSSLRDPLLRNLTFRKMPAFKANAKLISKEHDFPLSH